jgi:hypothetical protein
MKNQDEERPWKEMTVASKQLSQPSHSLLRSRHFGEAGVGVFQELERLNRLFVDREFRIKEMRDRVKELDGK